MDAQRVREHSKAFAGELEPENDLAEVRDAVIMRYRVETICRTGWTALLRLARHEEVPEMVRGVRAQRRRTATGGERADGRFVPQRTPANKEVYRGASLKKTACRCIN